MKKGYITILIILVLVIIVVLAGKGKKLEAPVTDNTTTQPAGDDMKMDMTPTAVPVDFNAAVTVTTAPVKGFTVTGSNFAFAPSTMTVKKGDHVKINFKNAQGFHNLRIDEFKVSTKQIKTDESETIEFIADKTGSFEYYCSVGTHRAMGMVGTLKVE